MVKEITLTQLENNLSTYKKHCPVPTDTVIPYLFKYMIQGKGYNQICSALEFDTGVGKRPIRKYLKGVGYSKDDITNIFINYERIKYFDILRLGECKSVKEYYQQVQEFILSNDYEYLTNLLAAPETVTAPYISDAKTVLTKFYSDEYINSPLEKSVRELNMEFKYSTKYWFSNAMVKYGMIDTKHSGFFDRTTPKFNGSDELEHVIFVLE